MLITAMLALATVKVVDDREVTPSASVQKARSGEKAQPENASLPSHEECSLSDRR